MKQPIEHAASLYFVDVLALMAEQPREDATAVKSAKSELLYDGFHLSHTPRTARPCCD